MRDRSSWMSEKHDGEELPAYNGVKLCVIEWAASRLRSRYLVDFLDGEWIFPYDIYPGIAGVDFKIVCWYDTPVVEY